MCCPLKLCRDPSAATGPGDGERGQSYCRGIPFFGLGATSVLTVGLQPHHSTKSGNFRKHTALTLRRRYAYEDRPTDRPPPGLGLGRDVRRSTNWPIRSRFFQLSVRLSVWSGTLAMVSSAMVSAPRRHHYHNHRAGEYIHPYIHTTALPTMEPVERPNNRPQLAAALIDQA